MKKATATDLHWKDMKRPIYKTAEEWVDCPTAQGYQVSTHGRVRSKTRTVINAGRMYIKAGKIIDQQEDENGYMFVRINPQGSTAIRGKTGLIKTKRWYVHRLVIESFKGPCPPDKFDEDGTYQVDHDDRNRKNNSPQNLLYKTRLENAQNRVFFGRDD